MIPVPEDNSLGWLAMYVRPATENQVCRALRHKGMKSSHQFIRSEKQRQEPALSLRIKAGRLHLSALQEPLPDS